MPSSTCQHACLSPARSWFSVLNMGKIFDMAPNMGIRCAGPQVLESQASADERSGSRIPKPSTHKRQLSDMSYSSGSASSSLTKSLLRQPGGMKGTPNQSNGTSGMIREPSTSSASMVRQPGDISGRRGSARQPSGANANGMVRQPSGTGRIARQPSGTSGQPSGTSGIARQPSGTTRIARQSSGTNGTGGMVRQPSGTGGAARLPNGTFGSGRQPSGMIGTGGMARQPSGTSGIPRQGSGANDMARQSSGRSNIPGAQNVAAARFTQPTQSSVARSTFSVAGSSHKRSAPPQATPESAEVRMCHNLNLLVCGVMCLESLCFIMDHHGPETPSNVSTMLSM